MGGPRPSYRPPPPPAPAPAPAPVDESPSSPAGQAKAKEETKKRRIAGQMGGRESTILTSGLGVTRGNQTLGS
jgi:hypothetical protein